MTKIKVPLQFHQSAVESAVEIQHRRRSSGISAISAVEFHVPAPCAHTHTRFAAHMQEGALTALHGTETPVTCGDDSAVDGTATALPLGGAR
ncbi:hypothetical protein [Streptomyces sp. RTd22]|uniref:hypothetical protein n=1 Tax=Streptomyces sp. RTd22 TaxID=1841249 RepID=UPI00131E40CC|nr:hypothetical protein [Streptomyces sp. RTd22]